MLDLDGQLSHANAGGVMHCRRHGSGEAGQADLTDAACAKLVDLRVGKVEEMHLDRRDVAGTAGMTDGLFVLAQNAGWLRPVGEVMIYERVLADADRKQVENYLRNKWADPMTRLEEP